MVDRRITKPNYGFVNTLETLLFNISPFFKTKTHKFFILIENLTCMNNNLNSLTNQNNKGNVQKG